MRTYRPRRFADRELALLIACCAALAVLLAVGLALWADSRPSVHDDMCAAQDRRVHAELVGVAAAGKLGQERLHRRRLIRLINDLSNADPSC